MIGPRPLRLLLVAAAAAAVHVAAAVSIYSVLSPLEVRLERKGKGIVNRRPALLLLLLLPTLILVTLPAVLARHF